MVEGEGSDGGQISRRRPTWVLKGDVVRRARKAMGRWMERWMGRWRWSRLNGA